MSRIDPLTTHRQGLRPPKDRRREDEAAVLGGVGGVAGDWAGLGDVQDGADVVDMAVGCMMVEHFCTVWPYLLGDDIRYQTVGRRGLGRVCFVERDNWVFPA
jgi:hypothetical protein